MESVGFFEGPEKLMEVWWTPILGADSSQQLELSGDLRTIPRYVKALFSFLCYY